MDHLIYTAMTGANAAAQRQAVLAEQPGQRVDATAFAPSCRPSARCRCAATAPAPGCSRWRRPPGHDDTPGADRSAPAATLDVAAQGNAWFAVQGLDGTEAYTRDGSFEVSADGTLVTSNGLTVLSDGGAPIDVPPGAEITHRQRRHRQRQDRRPAGRRRSAG